ncbi:MAG: hypothetical protein U0235_22425 [Polyangiaceae bacterium]
MHRAERRPSDGGGAPSGPSSHSTDCARSSTPPLRPRSDSACEKRAAALPELERFADFRDCMRESTTPTTMLPLGSFKAPREGWLVVRGRRGHYSFCDETRAYDLATGSAYVVRSCGGLSLRNDGSVDHGKTRATQKRSDEAGRLAVDALREAAFVMALTEDVDRNVVPSGFGWYLPEGVPAARADETHGRGFGASYRSSSAQTSLDWSWIVRGHAVRSGTLTWPEDYNDGARACRRAPRDRRDDVRRRLSTRCAADRSRGDHRAWPRVRPRRRPRDARGDAARSRERPRAPRPTRVRELAYRVALKSARSSASWRAAPAGSCTGVSSGTQPWRKPS